MLKNQTFVDPFIAQNIKNLESQMQKLIQTKLQIQNNYKLKQQTKQQLLKYNEEHRLQLRKVLEKCKLSMVQYFDKQVCIVSKDCMNKGVKVTLNPSQSNCNSTNAANQQLYLTKQNNTNTSFPQRNSVPSQQHERLSKDKSYSIKSKISQSTNRSSYVRSYQDNKSLYDLNSSTQNCYYDTKSTNRNNYYQFNGNNNNNDSVIQVGKSCRIHIRSRSKQFQRSTKGSSKQKYHNFNSEMIHPRQSIQQQSSTKQNQSDIIEINQFNITNKLQALKQCNTSFNSNQVPYQAISSILIQNQMGNSNKKNDKYDLLELKKERLSELLKKQNSQEIKPSKTSRQSIIKNKNANNLNQSLDYQHQYKNHFEQQYSETNQQHSTLITLYKSKIQCLQKKCQSLQQSNNLFYQTIKHQQQTINHQQREIFAQNQMIKSQNVKLISYEKLITDLQVRVKQLSGGNIGKNNKGQIKSSNGDNQFINNVKYANSTLLLQQQQQNVTSFIRNFNNTSQQQDTQNSFSHPHQTQQQLNQSTISKQQQTIKLIKTVQQLMGQLKKMREQNQNLKGERKLLLKKIQF